MSSGTDKAIRIVAGLHLVRPNIYGVEEVLMGKRINSTGAGLLAPPGGKVEFGETIIDAAVREALEECGVHLDPSACAVYSWKEKHQFGGHYIVFYVMCWRWEGEIENMEPTKCEAWEWYPTMATLRLGDKCMDPLDVLLELHLRCTPDDL